MFAGRKSTITGATSPGGGGCRHTAETGALAVGALAPPPVQTLSTTFAADVFKNSACSEQNRCLPVITHTDINTHEDIVETVNHTPAHGIRLNIHLDFRREDSLFNVNRISQLLEPE